MKYFRARGISPEQFQALNQLIDQGNQAVARIFAAYESDKNVYKLIDALKTLESSSRASAEPEEEEDDEDDNNDDENDDDEDDDADDDDVDEVSHYNDC